jgi:hypothetical protein
MEVLGWLLIPLAGLLIGVLWMIWRGREPKPVDPQQGMDDLARFRQAMEKPLPPLRRDAAADSSLADDVRPAADGTSR